MAEQTCIALFDFEGEGKEQLSFKKGDVIRLRRLPRGEGWGLGVLNTQLGWFPVDFVEISAQARAAVTHPPPPPLPTATSVRARATVAPQPPPPPPHPAGAGSKGGGGVETVKALFAFAAQDDDDISFSTGDLIQVLAKEGDWWKGTVNGKTGSFPRNYVSRQTVIEQRPATVETSSPSGAATVEAPASSIGNTGPPSPESCAPAPSLVASLQRQHRPEQREAGTQTAPVDTESEVPTTKPSGDAGSAAQEGARTAHPRDEDDAFATFQGGIFSGCTSEQKAELTAMMKQQADQADEVDRLRTHNDELGQTVEEQTQLLESTLEACENEIRGAKTHLEDETKRFEMAKRDLEEERSNHATDVSRGPLASLASLPESARDALGSIASNLETVLEECVICSELLLDGIGTPSFGLMSYSCGCSRGGHVRTLHVNCVVSMSNLNCPQCSDEIVLIAPSLMAPTAFRKFTVRKS